MTTVPQTGVTVRAHVEQLLTSATQVLEHVRSAIDRTRLRPVEREQFRRELAGVIATCETVRIWLDKGAPT